MANYTEKAIIRTFDEMLYEQPFDKITVSALVARCEISSNTFYYHFHDIYDLLDAWMNVQREAFLKKNAGSGDWAEHLKSALYDVKSRQKQVYHIFDALSRERLERYIFSSVEDEFYEYVKSYIGGAEVDEQELRGISDFCCYSLLGFFLKFLWMRMDADIDAGVDSLKRIIEGAIEYVVKQSEGGS